MVLGLGQHGHGPARFWPKVSYGMPPDHPELTRNLGATSSFATDNDGAAYLPEDSEMARWMTSAGAT